MDGQTDKTNGRNEKKKETNYYARELFNCGVVEKHNSSLLLNFVLFGPVF